MSRIDSFSGIQSLECLERVLSGNMGEMRYRDNEIVQAPKDWFEPLLISRLFEQDSNTWEKCPQHNIIYIQPKTNIFAC